MSHYTTPHWGAIALGLITAAGAAAILVEDAVHTGPTLDHVLSIIALVVTIGAGHLAVTAIRQWRLFRALGLGLVFLAGVLFCVVSTAGRNAEQADSRKLTAEARNAARVAKVVDLDRARLRHTQALAMADKEMTGQRCGVRCDDWKLRAREVQANITALEAELAGLGAPQPVNARLTGFARLLAALTGIDEARATATLALVWPYVLPLLLELGSIVFWGLGLGVRSDRRLDRVAPATTNHGAVPEDPRPGAQQRDVARGRQVQEFVRAYTKRHGHAPRTCEVSKALDLPKASASRWRARALA